MTFQADIGRSFVLRAEHGSDVIDFLAKFAKQNDVETATFTIIGALRCAKLAFYDQKRHEYTEISLSEPQEIACCVGNISLKENEPFVHAHSVLADRNGNVKAGHLLEGEVFAAEIQLTELLGISLVRKKDSTTGLYLWQQ